MKYLYSTTLLISKILLVTITKRDHPVKDEGFIWASEVTLDYDTVEVSDKEVMVDPLGFDT